MIARRLRISGYWPVPRYPRRSKQRLRQQFAAVDPIAVNDQIVHLQRRLLRLAAQGSTALKKAG